MQRFTIPTYISIDAHDEWEATETLTNILKIDQITHNRRLKGPGRIEDLNISFSLGRPVIGEWDPKEEKSLSQQIAERRAGT